MKSKKIIAVIFISALFLSVFSGLSHAKDPGETVGDFTINNYDGAAYTLSNSGTDYTVIIFWSTQCPYVQPFNDRINDYVKPYMDKGFTFWFINSNSTEPVDEIISHSKENRYIFPMLKDESNKVADLFEATRTPEVFILNKDRVILYHGRIDDNSYSDKVSSHDMKRALDEISEGKEVTVKSTKSFGCTIKRINK